MTEATKLDTFKEQLEKMKEQGMNVDVDAIMKSVTEPKKEEEQKLDKEALIMARLQLDKLIKDYETHYGPQGRGLEIMVKITKEDAADNFGEQWILGDKQNIKVIHVVEIGTKGKYEKFQGV